MGRPPATFIVPPLTTPVPDSPVSRPAPFALLPALFAAPLLAAPPNVGPTVDTPNPGEIRPAGPAPAFAPDIDPQMQAVLEEFAAFEPPKYPELTAFQVRNGPLPGDAVVSLLKKTGLPPSAPKVDVAHEVLPVGPEGGLLARTYMPLNADGSALPGPLPVIVYFHGGGWVIADLAAYEPSAMALAEKTGAKVVSVAYRLAPEHVYPAAHEDAFAAYKFVAENAAAMGGDPAKVAVVGESAGGNLAVATALLAKERGVTPPVHVVSVYPVADGDVTGAGYEQYADAKPLNKPFMEWFFDGYTPDWKTNQDAYPLVTLKKQDLSDLPPTTVINAEIDPLVTDGEELFLALERAGVSAERRVYLGVTHEFFGMDAVLEQAKAAQQYAADRLKAAFQN